MDGNSNPWSRFLLFDVNGLLHLAGILSIFSVQNFGILPIPISLLFYDQGRTGRYNTSNKNLPQTTQYLEFSL